MQRTTMSRTFIYAGIILLIGTTASLAIGDALKKTISIPDGANGREIMQAAVAEGRKLNYHPQRGEGKVTLTKKMPARFAVKGEKIYQITMMIAPGGEGRRALTLEGEYLGDLRDRDMNACFECDLEQIEKAAKKYLEAK